MRYRRYAIGRTPEEAAKGKLYKHYDPDMVDDLGKNPGFNIYTVKVTVGDKPLRLKDL